MCTDTINRRQVDPGHPIEECRDLTGGFVTFGGALARAGVWGAWLAVALVGQGAQERFDAGVHLGEVAMIKLIQVVGLLQRKQVIRSPRALERPCDSRLILLAAFVTERGQGGRITFSSEDGRHDTRSRHAEDVIDDMMQLDVHLGERFLHMLNVLRGIADQHVPLAHIPTKHTDVLSGPQ
jgi:hypothetical protein